LGELRIAGLNPYREDFYVRNGKKVMKERAYLPGYVLVEATLVEMC
jgi:transcriptional antiterminator NusG